MPPGAQFHLPLPRTGPCNPTERAERPAAGMPAADAADLVRRMADRYRLPDALRRADNLARTGPPAAAMTGRQPG